MYYVNVGPSPTLGGATNPKIIFTLTIFKFLCKKLDECNEKSAYK